MDMCVFSSTFTIETTRIEFISPLPPICRIMVDRQSRLRQCASTCFIQPWIITDPTVTKSNFYETKYQLKQQAFDTPWFIKIYKSLLRNSNRACPRVRKFISEFDSTMIYLKVFSYDDKLWLPSISYMSTMQAGSVGTIAIEDINSLHSGWMDDWASCTYTTYP